MIPFLKKKLEDLIQEKINNALEGALVNRGELTVNDLNDLTREGIYCLGAASKLPENAPDEADWSQLIVINNSFTQQIIIDPSSKYIYARQKSGSPPIWGAWRKFTGV